MSRITCGFMAAGLLAVSLPILTATTIGTQAAPVSAASQDSTADTPSTAPTDLSSRGGRGGGGGGRGGGGRGGGGRGGFGGGHGGGRGGFGGGHGGGRGGAHTRQVSGRTGGSRTGGSRTGGGTRAGTTRAGTARAGTTRAGTAGTARAGTTRTGTAGTARAGTARAGTARAGTARAGTARAGAARVGAARVGTTTAIRNRRFTTFAGRRFWWHGGWRTLIGVSLLTGFAVGPDFYYPDSYVALAEPACTGYTDDGCTLRWQDVAADDGSTIPQCVQFCPRVRKPAPAGAATAAPVAAAPRSGCEVEVFADKNLGGASFKTSEDQPLLNDDWDKKIASINVISGTWDFTTEQQYNGDAMRLTPGTYRDLGANWVDQISAFMCAQ